MLDKNLKKQIKTAVRKYLGDSSYRIFLFGSRATGENRKMSDVDLGILGKKSIPSFVKVKIEEELENSEIPFKIDLVDFKKVSTSFRETAMKKVVYL
ncbi:MAG: nucleotidyltransferase domain-containing protein [Patescibacteria group bacterium]|nr:nucleotidyltransferase domain-containing protein [Patescibacteria group bacterium]